MLITNYGGIEMTPTTKEGETVVRHLLAALEELDKATGVLISPRVAALDNRHLDKLIRIKEQLRVIAVMVEDGDAIRGYKRHGYPRGRRDIAEGLA